MIQGSNVEYYAVITVLFLLNKTNFLLINYTNYTTQTLNLIIALIHPPNTTTKQHAIINIQLNIVACPTYPEKFIRDMLLHRLYYFT